MRRAIMVGVALLLPGATIAIAQGERRIPFDQGWELAGEGTRIETYQGKSALRLRTGEAVRRDVAFMDGTIEFDVAVTRHRSFVYLAFRMAADGEYEELYFRPHKSSLPDAIQYGPVWRGETNWQLYHGPGSTAAVAFDPDRWVRVRLVLRGQRAALFFGEGAKPVTVLDLARPAAPGYLAFLSSVPAGGAPDGVSVAAIANVVLRPGVVPFDFPPERTVPPVAGLLTSWQLSPPFEVRTPGPLGALPDSLLSGRAAWPTFPAEPNGVLVVGRHLPRPARLSGVIGRLVLQSGRAGLQKLDLGFSDNVTVFVNGQPLFAADAHYSFDQPRQEGLIGLSQSAVWLPLVAGTNEVLVALTDGFGGRGLIGRLDPAGPGKPAGAGR